MLLAAAALAWSWLASPILPVLPPTEISYLGRPGERAGPAPDGIGGLVAVPPAAAVAIRFAGGFDFGATKLLQDALDNAPHARLVAFDSPGGRLLSAQGVAEVIHARHLDTTVELYCASACTIAYIAGVSRSAAPGARFAFHLGESPILADLAATVMLQIERKWFVLGGASLSFAERSLHAPNPAPYLAPVDELMAAGYVQRITPPPPSPRRGSPLLAAVAAIEPQTAAALLWAEIGRERSGMTPARSAAITAQRAGLVADRWFSHASDSAVLGMIDATVAALEALAARDAMACMTWQIGLQDQDRAAGMLPPALLARYRAAQRQVLLDANTYPVPTPEDDGSLAAAEIAVRTEVAGAFGRQALAIAASREHGFDDPARSCAAGMAYLRALRGQAGAARLLRWALAAG